MIQNAAQFAAARNWAADAAKTNGIRLTINKICQPYS